MARISASLFLGGLLLVATAFCIAEANVQLHPSDLARLNAGVRVKVTAHNKARHDVRLVLGVVKDKVLDVKRGAVALLGPVKVKAQLLNILRVEVFVLNSKGELLKVKAVANVDLGVVGKVVKGVREVVLDVVEGAKGEALQLVAGKVVVAEIKLKVDL